MVERRLRKIGAREVGVRQVGAVEVCRGEVRPLQDELAQVEEAEVLAREIRRAIGARRHQHFDYLLHRQVGGPRSGRRDEERRKDEYAFSVLGIIAGQSISRMAGSPARVGRGPTRAAAAGPRPAQGC
jgi:hypothetical protein